MSTAAYMQNIGKNGEAVKVLEALCTYSRKRGNKNHKEVIFRAISQMGGDSPEAICRIGDAEQQLFAGDTSLYAGDFYWFYGDSLQIWDVQKMPCMCLSSAFRFERTVWEKKTITQSWQGGDGLSANFLAQTDAKEERIYCIL